MSRAGEQLFGSDMLLDDNFDAVLTASGLAVEISGERVVVQDIRLALVQQLGELFYDQDHGGRLHDFLFSEDNLSARLSIIAECKRVLKRDARIIQKSIKVVDLQKTVVHELEFDITFILIGIDIPQNLTLSIGGDTGLIIKDANPNTN